MGEILVEKHDGVAVLTLNRPERLNAITGAMLDGFSRALVETLPTSQMAFLTNLEPAVIVHLLRSLHQGLSALGCYSRNNFV